MKNADLIQYNLSNISLIDKDIKSINEDKNKYLDKINTKFKINKNIEKLRAKVFQSILIIAISLTTYLNMRNIITSILISLAVIFIINMIIKVLLSIFKIDNNYLDRVNEYTDKVNSLLSKRNTYINLYKYSKYGEKAIYDNIRLKVNNKKFYEYDKYMDSLFLEKDSYEYKTLNEMRNKEHLLVNNIKNKVYMELNSPVKTEKLSNEQLKLIDSML